MEIKRFHYELRRTEDGLYIADMSESLRENWSYPCCVGDNIPLPEKILFKNNSWKLRKCLIDKIRELDGNNFIAYLTITKDRIRPFAFIDWENMKSKFINGVDWSGDGWLKFGA